LSFDEKGGVREVPIVGDRKVLDDSMVRRLAAVAERIKRAFGGVQQDIEWAFHAGRVYILQARPYKSQ
jgi:phosphoenolpyruvate synthase/pyruvate phosphate dikinase